MALSQGRDMTKLKNITGSERLFTYKVAYDGGSAPNPFHGICTLAICKPVIRRVAEKGDVIVGLGCDDEANRIVYCMLVSECVTWTEYIQGCKAGFVISKEEPKKKYVLKGRIPKNNHDPGDCIWIDAVGYFDARDSWSGHDGEEDFNRDVMSGENVLIGETFWYFGKGDQYRICLPEDMNIIPGRGHRSNANNDYRENFIQFFNRELAVKNISTIGMLGTPAIVPGAVDKMTCSRCRAEARELDEHGEESL